MVDTVISIDFSQTKYRAGEHALYYGDGDILCVKILEARSWDIWVWYCVEIVDILQEGKKGTHPAQGISFNIMKPIDYSYHGWRLEDILEK